MTPRKPPILKVLVCGSRKFRNPFVASLAIDNRIADISSEYANGERLEFIHGAAPGADQIAAEAAERRGHLVRGFRAEWEKYGKRAGIVRNLQLLDQRPDLVLAFWNGKSRGTAHTIAEAHRREIPIEIVTLA